MKLNRLLTLSAALLMLQGLTAQRTEWMLEKGWKFTQGEQPQGATPELNDLKWQTVTVPHDWAIFGPFDRKHDLQEVAVTQNGETKATVKTGRTGGLPYVGVGWYRTQFEAPQGKQLTLKVDGAMSEARVYINGHEACFWPFGYNTFHCDITPFLNNEGSENLLAIRLENKDQSSRWYSGAGLYRNVHLIATDSIHVPVWGTYVTTPSVKAEFAAVKLQTKVVNSGNDDLRVQTNIVAPDGTIVATRNDTRRINHGQPFEQNFIVEQPKLWSPETPHLYYAVTTIFHQEKQVDQYTTRFGIRTIEVIAEKGFYLNGQLRKFQGVCNHHDLGPLGAAVNYSALRHQLRLLKEMGCDAIRTAHNMPTPELVELCDEMGFMMMVEPFDEWEIAKCENGYHRFFNEWAERDMVNMLHHFRNNASVVMWSVGNEVPTQCSDQGYQVASFLQAICHREDPTRPVTCGMDQVSCILNNGFAAMIEVPGLNYRAHRYEEAYAKLPQGLVLGSETASTVSSRGVYKFPVVKKANALYPDHQSSSYDLEYCSWSNAPDDDFALADDHPWTMGQFVWTGFDYLGEPSPYDTDAWPSHSSLFGIIDLASIPKDRYFLYRSIWNQQAKTLHLLPHWNWEGREGEVTPVFAYTNYPEAELFLNGKSQGRRRKTNESPQHRYRLMWMDVRYEPGEIKVVAYDEAGNFAEERTIRTAGKADRIELIPHSPELTADGKELCYVTVRVVDKAGNLCPTDSRMMQFAVTGAGSYRASANGDPTSLDLFHLPQMPLFSGELTTIVQAAEVAGELTLKVSAKGVKSANLKLQVVQP